MNKNDEFEKIQDKTLKKGSTYSCEDIKKIYGFKSIVSTRKIINARMKLGEIVNQTIPPEKGQYLFTKTIEDIRLNESEKKQLKNSKVTKYKKTVELKTYRLEYIENRFKHIEHKIDIITDMLYKLMQRIPAKQVSIIKAQEIVKKANEENWTPEQLKKEIDNLKRQTGQY